MNVAMPAAFSTAGKRKPTVNAAVTARVGSKVEEIMYQNSLPIKQQTLEQRQAEAARVFQALGGTKNAAYAMGVSSSRVSQMRLSGIPELRRQQLQVIRPDLFDKGHDFWAAPSESKTLFDGRCEFASEFAVSVQIVDEYHPVEITQWRLGEAYHLLMSLKRAEELADAIKGLVDAHRSKVAGGN